MLRMYVNFLKESNVNWAVLLFSAVIHWIFFSSFVFTFPVKGVAHKPVFVFLGSILNKQEVNHSSYSRTPWPEQKIINPGGQLKVASSQSQFYPIQTTAVPKPRFSGHIKPKPKIFLKPKYLTVNTASQGKQVSLEDLGIELTVPPAPKLRLYDNDKN